MLIVPAGICATGPGTTAVRNRHGVRPSLFAGIGSDVRKRLTPIDSLIGSDPITIASARFLDCL
jgi:hypothetical protein